MIEDELLKLRFKRGSEDALRRIYEKYLNYLLSMAMAFLNNGQFAQRMLVYRYRLSNGQTMDLREPAGALKPILSPAQKQEWDQAKKAGSGQVLGTHQGQVLGRTVVFTERWFVLSDGTAILWSVGKPQAGP